jgi:predicted SAM-dependent methyltransferase
MTNNLDLTSEMLLILQYGDKSFDIVYSNSVIEHLYTYENQEKMAREIRRIGKYYFVQTPANEFFIEPYLITPFIHWFPIKMQKILMRNFTIWGIITRPQKEYIENFLHERRLLNFEEFKQLFPEAEIIIERLFFMPKSYIAIKK